MSTCVKLYLCKKKLFMKNIGVLFDLDGVLIDSETIYTQFWNNAIKKYPTGIDNFAYVIKGNNLERILNTYFPDMKVQAELLDMIDQLENDMEYPIFDGVIEFLEDLRSHNIPCAIVTSSDKTKMEKLYKQHPDFKNYFDAVVTGDMVKKSKPDPECFLMGARLINRNPEDCYIFEDSNSGLIAAEGAGGKVFALATTLKREDIKIKAGKIIDNFTGFKVKDMLNF